ncbi:MAG: hypothetical protein ACJ77I_04585, partial [Chloroflexota bacterium]
METVSRIRPSAEAGIRRVAAIGDDPGDDEDLRQRKALLVLISILILPVAGLWSALYLVLGSPVGYAPLVYFAVIVGSIVVFSRNRDFAQLLRTGQVAILLAPTLSMIPLGGFVPAAAVGFWGILAPLAALVFSDVRDAVRWFVAWVIVFLASGIIGAVIEPVPPPLPAWFTSAML